MTTTPPDAPAETCCGQDGSWSPKPGEPIAQSCRLCPRSPTYWRRAENRTDRTPFEAVKPVGADAD